MAEINATILIPDISGFTAFMTSTELTHSSHAINILIDAMLEAVGEDYEVSEIEGDAILLIKKGPAPARKEIMATCLNIFNAFHFRRKFMQQHTICPCGACQAIINLTLKFVVHHGPLAEIKVGRFVKQSGPEMIVAHRLLKNSIDNNEYLLMTEKLLQQVADPLEPVEVDWARSSEEYASIGKIDYRFTLLGEARKNVPDPPALQNLYRTDNTSYLEVPVAANFMDVYMVMMNIAGRAEWMPGLLKVEQDKPTAYIGSLHLCTFENYQSVVSPLRMTLSEDGIMYAESCVVKEMDLSLVNEFVFRKIDDTSSCFACRFMNAAETPVPAEILAVHFEKMRVMADRLKERCEKSKTASSYAV